MIRATLEDRQITIDLLLEFFENNENIHSIVKNDAKKPQRLIHFAEYMFEWAIAMDALYLMDGKKGFAIIYLSDKKLKILKEIQLNLKLIFKVITIYRLLKILKKRLKIIEIRKRETKNNKYLYFYALGINKNQRGYFNSDHSPIIEVKRFINDLIKKNQLTMYVETINPRNKRLYESADFLTYDVYKDKEKEFSTWFLKKEKEKNDRSAPTWDSFKTI
jgi:hypothetical protein